MIPKNEEIMEHLHQVQKIQTQLAQSGMNFKEILQRAAIVSEIMKAIDIQQLNRAMAVFHSPAFAKSMTIYQKMVEEIIPNLERIVHLRPLKMLGEAMRQATLVQSNLMNVYEIQTARGDLPKLSRVKPLEVTERDKLNELLDELDPVLKRRREGSWQAFKSNNPDRISQSANSMIELLRQVTRKICGSKQPKEVIEEVIKERYGSDSDAKWAATLADWIEATTKCFSATKEKLEGIKHHPDYKDEILCESVLISAERLVLLLLVK